jgi:enoyl-CoA hydratase
VFYFRSLEGDLSMASSGPERLDISTRHCIVERDGHVVTLTMNRPEARNAFSIDMLVGLADGFAYADDEPDVRVAILTGADGCFSAGADLKAMSRPSEDEQVRSRLAADPNLHWRALLRDHRLRKPLIAAVEGYAVAGGTELVVGTDIRIAAQSAVFGLYEAKRGLFPLAGSAVRLPRQIPYTRAMEILLTARDVGAAEAYELGLVGRVVPDGQALAVAREVAGQIAANGPVAVQAILRAYRETEGMPDADAMAVQDKIGWEVIATEDAREGSRAFAEKRPPIYRGR